MDLKQELMQSHRHLYPDKEIIMWIIAHARIRLNQKINELEKGVLRARVYHCICTLPAVWAMCVWCETESDCVAYEIKHLVRRYFYVVSFFFVVAARLKRVFQFKSVQNAIHIKIYNILHVQRPTLKHQRNHLNIEIEWKKVLLMVLLFFYSIIHSTSKNGLKSKYAHDT